MSAQHTPGPWTVDSNGRTVMNAAGNAVVAETTHAPNAHLIAAAPEMLEALQEIAFRAENQVLTTADTIRTIGDLARAAIAKAAGKEA